jgi:molecular chaperone DnaK (HSP70)
MIVDAAGICFFKILEIVELKVLALVHENIGAAVRYGIDRNDDFLPTYIAFYNMGASSTKVTIAKYRGLEDEDGKKYEHIEVVAESWEENLGGNNFDRVLMNMLIKKFNSQEVRKGKKDIRGMPRIMNRLKKEVSKIKEVLSANKETYVKIDEIEEYDGLFV